MLSVDDLPEEVRRRTVVGFRIEARRIRFFMADNWEHLSPPDDFDAIINFFRALAPLVPRLRGRFQEGQQFRVHYVKIAGESRAALEQVE